MLLRVEGISQLPSTRMKLSELHQTLSLLQWVSIREWTELDEAHS